VDKGQFHLGTVAVEFVADHESEVWTQSVDKSYIYWLPRHVRSIANLTPACSTLHIAVGYVDKAAST